MARRVFFSFHYEDVSRANVVRNSHVVARTYEQSVRFYDKSLWEKVKKEGELAIKRMINRGLEGTSVTCVLIGQQTWQRPWVRYEILKSLSRGNGILGVHIHNVGMGLLSKVRATGNETGFGRGGLLAGGGSAQGAGLAPAGGLVPRPTVLTAGLESPPSGPNPLHYLGYTIDRVAGRITFHHVDSLGRWQVDDRVPTTGLSDLQWLSTQADANNLASLFPVYRWKEDDGYNNFAAWVEAAARFVRR